MKKPLLLATMLLSSAAQADIYFCTPLQYAASTMKRTIAIKDEEFVSQVALRNIYSSIVDTSKGMSIPNAKSYEGQCLQDKKYVICDKKSEFWDSFDRIVINKDDWTYSKIYQDYRRSEGSTTSGTCVKA